MGERVVKSIRLTEKTKGAIIPQEVEDILLEQIDEVGTFECPFCDAPWPEEYEAKGSHSIRLDPVVAEKMEKLQMSGKVVSAIIEKCFGVCPMCGGDLD